MRNLVVIIVILSACSITPSSDSPSSKKPIDWGENPWPEIRKERLNSLLPAAMSTVNFDAWLVICRENDNDPMADHVGGENAGGTAVFLFYFGQEGFETVVFYPVGEATALDELDIHNRVIPVQRG